jgi:hypothetical protein
MAAAPTYTITSASFEAEAGDNISSGANPTVTLVISPTAGNTILSSNFSIGETLPSEVASAVFSQDGANVNCLITFDASFVMPSNDVELLIDIDGTANEQTFTVAGAYSTDETNTTTISENEVAFSQTAVAGTEVTLFTKTFTADPNHLFYVPPYFYQDPNAKNQSDYIITYSDTGLGSGKNLIISSRTYTVKYIVGEQNESLNDLYFVASASPIFSATAEVSSYKINTTDILQKPESRQIDFFGGDGAAFTLNVTDGGSNDDDYSLTIPSTGIVSLVLNFPHNLMSGDKTWTFTLTGDVASPFTQDNPFTITQLGT